MGTDIYIGVQVTDAPKGLLEKKKPKFPDLELMDSDGWDTGFSWDPDTKEMTSVETSYTLAGTGRYDDTQALYEWAKKFTLKHEGCTVTVSEEWNEGEPGQESNVYRAGELVREESKVNAMVPMDLYLLLDEAKALLAEYVSPDPAQSLSHHYSQIAPSLAAALEKLVKGLS